MLATTSPGPSVAGSRGFGCRNGSRVHRQVPVSLRFEPHCFSSLTGGKGSPSRLRIPDIPPKVPRRPPSKGSKRETLSDIARRVPVEVIRPYFNYPLRTAAEALSISVTTLKRLCRRHGVKRWPHRQLSSVNRAVAHLESKRQAANDDEYDEIVGEQLRQLYRRRDNIIEMAFVNDSSEADASDNGDIAAIFESSGDTPTDNASQASEVSSEHGESPHNAQTPWWQHASDASSWPPLHVHPCNTSGRLPAIECKEEFDPYAPSGILMDWPSYGRRQETCERDPTPAQDDCTGDDGAGIGLRTGLQRSESCSSTGSGGFRAASVLVRLPGLSGRPPPLAQKSASPLKINPLLAIVSGSTAPPSPISPGDDSTTRSWTSPASTSTEEQCSDFSPQRQHGPHYCQDSPAKRSADLVSLNDLLLGPDHDEFVATLPSPPAIGTVDVRRGSILAHSNKMVCEERSHRCTHSASADLNGKMSPVLISAGPAPGDGDHW